MVGAAEEFLLHWVTDVLGGIDVLFDGPREAVSQAPAVSFTLLHLGASPRSARMRDRDVELTFRYLVTTQAESAGQANALLAELLVAATGNSVLRVEEQGAPAAVWQGFGLPPRPGLVVVLPLSVERPRALAKPVLEPLVVRHVGLEPLEGVVIGPNDMPLAGVVVELPTLSLRTRTDLQGRFRLGAVPAGEGAGALSLTVGGRQVDVPADQRPVTLKLDSKEA